MRTIPGPVQNLIDAFARLPGIGPKTASRLAFFLLKAPAETSLDLAQALEAMQIGTSHCTECFNITLAGEEKCDICASSMRDQELICVVEEPLDVLAIERTGAFQGKYHVLQGVLSPIEGIGPDQIKVFPLLERLKAGQVREVISPPILQWKGMRQPSTCNSGSARWGSKSRAWHAVCRLVGISNTRTKAPSNVPCHTGKRWSN